MLSKTNELTMQSFLSEREAVALGRALTTPLPPEMLAHKHMAERHMCVDGLEGEGLWLFYLPDFTRIFRDWYTRYINAVASIYDPTAYTHFAQSGGYLLLKYQGVRPKTVVRQVIEQGNYRFVDALLERARVAEGRAEQALESGGLGEMIEAVTHFAGFGLDNIFPDELCAKEFPQVPLAELHFSAFSTWRMLYERARDAHERMLVGARTYQEALQEYADKTSFIRWGDIASREEDLAYGAHILGGMTREYPNYAILWRAQVAEREALRIGGSPEQRHARFVAACEAKLPSGKRELFHFLARFATIAQHYNEMRRYIFTKALRQMRDHAESLCVDWLSVPLDALVAQADNERR